MMKLTTVLLVSSLVAGCSEPLVGTDQEESRTDFGQMVAGTIGILNGLGLLGYGCYCGPDNDVGVIPVDEVDACCLTHDHAWMNAPAGCDCNTASYDYTRPGGVITCTPGQAACATYCCEADKAFSECVQRNLPLDPANQRYDRTTCEPLECVVDDDCEGGTWCNGGRCVPYCGGGGLGHDLGGSGIPRRAMDCADPVDDGDVAEEPVPVPVEAPDQAPTD